MYYSPSQVAKLPFVINDGKWHHICITWTTRDGVWEAYQDGTQGGSGENLAPYHPIKPQGVLVLGQEQVLAMGAAGGGTAEPEGRQAGRAGQRGPGGSELQRAVVPGTSGGAGYAAVRAEASSGGPSDARAAAAWGGSLRDCSRAPAGTGRPLVPSAAGDLFPGRGSSPIGRLGWNRKQQSPRPSAPVGQLLLAE